MPNSPFLQRLMEPDRHGWQRPASQRRKALQAEIRTRQVRAVLVGAHVAGQQDPVTHGESADIRTDLDNFTDGLVADRVGHGNVVLQQVVITAAHRCQDHANDRVGGLLDGRVGYFLQGELAALGDQ